MTEPNTSMPVRPPTGWPLVLRGGLIAVFVWLVIQVIAALAILADRLFTAYLLYELQSGLPDELWHNWLILVFQISAAVFLVVLWGRLLATFFRRKPSFSFAFLTVLLVATWLQVGNWLLHAIFRPEEEVFPVAIPSVLIALGIYQWLLHSPRANAVFAPPAPPPKSPITDA